MYSYASCGSELKNAHPMGHMHRCGIPKRLRPIGGTLEHQCESCEYQWVTTGEDKADEIVSDNINHPNHYTAYQGLEIIDLTEQMNFNRGNAVKYIARAGLKDKATEIEDLKKAAWYIQREIERISPKQSLEDELYQNGIEAMRTYSKPTVESDSFKNVLVSMRTRSGKHEMVPIAKHCPNCGGIWKELEDFEVNHAAEIITCSHCNLDIRLPLVTIKS